MKPFKPIPYAHQSIDLSDLTAVKDVLLSDWLTQGPTLVEFEEKIASYCGAKYAVSFCNGTAALHAAMVALGLGTGDTGIVPSITFAATANCLLYTGAKPVFCDITSGIPLLDAQDTSEKIDSSCKVILPVHFAGEVVDIKILHNLAQKHHLAIVEDACHAFGSEFFDQKTNQYHKVGSCLYSDMTIFSFHPVKNITTGEGGIITTNNLNYYEKLKKFRHHGISLTGGDYSIDELGTNYRLTDLQAALGLSQLKRVDEIRDRKISIFGKYLEAFKPYEQIQLLMPHDLTHKHMHLALLQVSDPKLRDPLFNFLRSQGIMVAIHYKPLYRHPLYQAFGQTQPSLFPQAEDYFSRTLTIPLFADLTEESQNYVIENILKGINL